MQTITTEFLHFTHSLRADLIGIAPIDRFADVPPNHHPRSIFPETQSVIVLGKRITRGTLRGIEEGTQFEIYGQYGQSWLADRMLAITTVSLATWIEDHQWEAVPLQDLPPQAPPSGVPVREGLPAPNVMIDVKDAAVRAGLGDIGLCGELLTPEFGPRQRFQLILTDAPLDPTPLRDTPVCDQCGACARTCPLDAIDPATGLIDYALCRQCQNGARANPSHPAGLPDRLGALCVRSCVDHLEHERRIANVFASPFRKRPAWQKDILGRSSLQEAEQ